MRFDFSFSCTATGWNLTLGGPGGARTLLPDGRPLGRTGTEPACFPLPDPRTMDPAKENDEVRRLCAPSKDGYHEQRLARLVGQSCDTGSVASFGRYLFLVLIGDDLWEKIDEFARGERIEIALNWVEEDKGLNRLPWETLRASEHFLSSLPEVAITRRVDGRCDRIEQCTTCPRVLFVVGSSLNDRNIRPGAEYLGLLRSLESNDLHLHTQLILDASPGRLRAAIESFRPDVVHFICHGVVRNGTPRLLLQDDLPQKPGVEILSGALISHLTANRQVPLPKAVVLTACSTANSHEISAGRPYAAELVSAGVPMVIGMSGEVSDRACRLFSKSFYCALLSGEDAATAAAEGRRAAVDFSSYKWADKIDWALPSIFLSKNVQEARLWSGVSSEMSSLHNLALHFAPKVFPAFCDRFELLHDFSVFMSDEKSQRQHCQEPKRMLLVYSPRFRQEEFIEDFIEKEFTPKWGRTRLLGELAACAFREGHVACVLEPSVLAGENWPTDAVTLLSSLHDAAKVTAMLMRSKFPRFNFERHYIQDVLDWKRSGAKPAGLDERIANEESGDDSFFRRFAVALRLHLDDLLEDARRVYPEPLRAKMRLLLLIDDVHRMNDAVGVLLYKFLGPYGLNLTGDDKFRVVLAYAEEPEINQHIAVQAIRDWRGRTHGILTRDLSTFSRNVKLDEGGDRLPYKQFLLNWHEMPKGGGSRQPCPLTLSETEHANRTFDELFENLAELSHGVPARLASSPAIATVIRNATRNKHLRAADDENALIVASQSKRS